MSLSSAKPAPSRTRLRAVQVSDDLGERRARQEADSWQDDGNVWCGPTCWRCRVCGAEFPRDEWSDDRFRLWNAEHGRCKG